jgi:hypothetical protein
MPGTNGVGRNVQAIQFHSAANGLCPNGLVATRGKRLPLDPSLPLSNPLFHEWTHTRPDLPLFFGPTNGPPALDEITEGLNLIGRRCLRAPKIQNVDAPARINPDHDMDGEITPRSRLPHSPTRHRSSTSHAAVSCHKAAATQP